MEKPVNKTTLIRRWGIQNDNPTDDEMRSALGELDAIDPEHPDCWLSDQSGWSITAFASGLVTIENTESGEGPWHMHGQSKDEILRLWKHLQQGNLAAIQAQNWIDGYNS